MTQVDWPDYPALLESQQGRLHQLQFWDPVNQRWTMLVPRPSAQVAEGWAEVTSADIITLLLGAQAGHFKFTLKPKA